MPKPYQAENPAPLLEPIPDVLSDIVTDTLREAERKVPLGLQRFITDKMRIEVEKLTKDAVIKAWRRGYATGIKRKGSRAYCENANCKGVDV